ncbi:MAG: hypothetical protein MUO53_15660 [Maribacter sp.]|nr:hypothetical protein [Maribacter sp.]
MKKRLLILFMAVMFSSGNQVLGNCKNRPPLYPELDLANCQVYSGFITSEILKYPWNTKFSCTRSIKIRVLTEAGIIGFGLSITAGTCQAADAGITNAIRGFIKGIY